MICSNAVLGSLPLNKRLGAILSREQLIQILYVNRHDTPNIFNRVIDVDIKSDPAKD